MTTATLTSKNQITIPAAVLKEKQLKKGTRLQVHWQGNDLVFSPEQSLDQILDDVQAHLRPLIRKPMTDKELQDNLHNHWPRDMQ